MANASKMENAFTTKLYSPNARVRTAGCDIRLTNERTTFVKSGLSRILIKLDLEGV